MQASRTGIETWHEQRILTLLLYKIHPTILFPKFTNPLNPPITDDKIIVITIQLMQDVTQYFREKTQLPAFLSHE